MSLPSAKGSYNRMVFRQFCVSLFGLCLLTACRDELKTKEKVQEAVIGRLQAHSGLDLNALDVTTTDVTFEKDKAVATVVFHPKGDQSVNGGMTMKYNLQERDGKWVVTGVDNAHGAPLGTHPPASQPDGPAGTSLPAGHPSIAEPPKQ